MRNVTRLSIDSVPTNRLARLALLAVAILWGSSLLVVKSTAEDVSPSLLIALRFSIAALLLSVLLCKRFVRLGWKDWIGGAVTGLFLFGAHWIQTLGVTLAMPGKSAFLSSIYCVLVPFAVWLFSNIRPHVRNICAALMCTAGIMLASITETFSVETGDLLALLSGVFFAFHIAAVGKFSRNNDPAVMTALQFIFCAVYAWVAVLFMDGIHPVFSMMAIPGILYLALICTLLALLLQNIGQKYTDSASASILMSTESLFGTAFSVAFFGEKITLQMLAGFVLIFISVLLSELGGKHRNQS
ncbi:DMT family transporter [Butyricicoccus sp.]|uniref:DMT family transporter n=1 Tax=Butyricicoccus sp. TaxID=2049021 RepID=UPI003AAE08C8